MKRIVKYFAIAAVSAFAFISCSQEQNPVSNDNGIHFTIRTSENPQVKSFIESDIDGKYIPKWSKGDKLAMFVGAITEGTKATGVLTNVSETNEVATFDGTVAGLSANGTFKSFSPASALEKGYGSGNVGVNLAVVQKPSSLTIDQACDILVAKETAYTADETGVVKINDLFFKRMFSIVKVDLNGPASLNGEKVSKFSLTAPEGTGLTGCAVIDLATATIDEWTTKNSSVAATYTEDAPKFGGKVGLENEVWLVVNPVTIESGAKVVFAGETANYTFSKEVTLSKALTFPESQLAVINLTLSDENCMKKHGYRASIYAGHGDGTKVQDGVGVSAMFSFPEGIVPTGDGNYYILQRGKNNFAIRKMDSSGNVTTVQTSGAKLNFPWQGAVAPSGELYFCNKGGHQLMKMNAAGVVEVVSGFTLDNPMGVKFDSDGFGYLSNRNGGQLIKFKDDAVVKTFSMRMPTCSAVDAAGRVIVGTENSGYLYMIDKEGEIKPIAGDGNYSGSKGDGVPGVLLGTSTIGKVNGIWCAKDGALYFCDVTVKPNAVRKLTPGAGGDYSKGRLETIAKGFYPSDVVVSEDCAKIFVTSATSHTIRLIEII